MRQKLRDWSSGFGRSGGRRAEVTLGLEGQQGLRVVGEVAEAAGLGDDDGLDVNAHVGRYLRVSDLFSPDAFAVVFDEDIGCLTPGYVAVILAGLADEHLARREAVHSEHENV